MFYVLELFINIFFNVKIRNKTEKEKKCYYTRCTFFLIIINFKSKSFMIFKISYHIYLFKFNNVLKLNVKI
jgi:hypothetical protein